MKKWFVLLLIMALCCAPLSEGLCAAIDDEIGIVGATDAALTVQEEGGEAADSGDEAALDDEAVPEDDEVDLGRDDDAAGSEAPDSVPQAPAEAPFTSGYGRIAVESADVYAALGDAEPFAVLTLDDVALAVALDEDAHCLNIAFNSARGVVTGYVDAVAIQPLTDEELDAFMNGVAQNVEALYMDDINFPLATLDCRFCDEQTDTTTQKPTEVGDITDPEADDDGTEPQENVDQPIKQTEVETDTPESLESAPEKQTAVDDTVVENPVPDTQAQAETPVAQQQSEASDVSPKVEAPVSQPQGTAPAASASSQSAANAAQPAQTPEATDPGEYAVAAAETAVAPTDFSLPSSLTLGLKEKYALLTPVLVPANSITTFVWRSKNPKIVTVDAATGALVAKAKGTTYVYATSDNGIERKCKVTVKKAPSKITLNVTSLVLVGGGQTYKLTHKLEKSNTASTIYYTSSNPGVVSVSANGLLTTGTPGAATITARTFNKKKATCTVKVLDPSVPQPVKIQLDATELTIGVQQKVNLNPVMLTSDGSTINGTDYTVTSSDSKKLKVTAKGVITAVKTGKYTVTVTAYNGVTAKCSVRVVKAPSKVAVSPSKPIVGVGQSKKLTVSFPKGGVGTYTFKSSKTSVCTVDADGKITGVAEGSAVITVKTHNGKTAKAKVTVTKSPDYVSLNADYTLEYDELTGKYETVYRKTLDPGQTFQLKYDVQYGTSGEIERYESKNTAVATVSSKGMITAVSPGTAEIVAYATGGSKTVCKVTVTGTPAAQLAFSASEASVRVGQSVAIPALTGTYIDAATLEKATYVSGNTGIFTVAYSEADAEWQITGVSTGSAKLTATASGGVAQLSVTVLPAAAASTQIHFEDSVVYLAVGESWTPTVFDEYDVAVKATFASDNRGVAGVNDSGMITALAAGDATITATAGDMTASTKVSVRADLATVTINPDQLTLSVGARSKLTAKVNGNSTANVSWSSSDTAVATVSASGVVIGRKAGTATVTATSYGGGKATCEVSVKSAPSTVSIEPASITARMDEGGKQLSWSFGNSAEYSEVTFKSSDTSVATVDEKGYVTFKGIGVAKVSLTTANGLVATIEVTVTTRKPVSTTPTYRLFAAYEYNKSGVSGYLPFTANNAKSVASVFGRSSIGGLTYSTKVMGNPSKTALLSGISDYFSGTTDIDVSIIYLCSHGHMTKGYGGYRMSLPGYNNNTSNANYYITSSEIMNCVSRIRGNVILIIDSCYSGAFLQDASSTLKALNGRVAVMTAASDTRATFYNVKSTSKSVDFFTFFLLKGLGYNERDKWWNMNAAGDKGAYPGYLAADMAGNNDGIVTVREFYRYASKSIASNIPNYMKKSWYWGDRTRVQVTRFYEGNLGDLIIYKAK